jgi:acetolactate synthase regulatory subunit
MFSDFTVPSISPTEQDLDGTTNIKVTLKLKRSRSVVGLYGGLEKIFDIAQSFTCFYSTFTSKTLEQFFSLLNGFFTKYKYLIIH